MPFNVVLGVGVSAATLARATRRKPLTEAPFARHRVSAAEAGCQSEFVRCHLACVPLGVKPTCREDAITGSATAFKGDGQRGAQRPW